MVLLNIWVSFKISEEMKKQILIIQKDEYRGNLSETIRALLMWAIEQKQSGGRVRKGE